MNYDESNELDPDLLMDMPSPGQGGLGGLNDFDDGFGEEGKEEGGTYERSISHGRHLYEGQDVLQHDAASDIHPRRNINFSLADELANAMDPAGSSGSSLLQELGLEVESADVVDYDDETVDEEHSLASIPSQSLRSSHGRNQSEVQKLRPHEPPSSPHSLKQRIPSISSRPKSRASTLSLKHSLNGMSSPLDLDFREDEAAAAAFSQGMSDIETSITSTQVFLEHIYDYGGNVDVKTDENSVSDMSQDRQPILEKLLNTFIKTLYELARVREEQIRELAETERNLGNADASWQMVVAELEPLPPSTSTSTSTSSHSIFPIKARLPTLSEEGEQASTDDSPPTPASELTSTIELSDSIPQQIQEVRLVTDTIIETLGNISEHTQVSKATNLDATRKFKSIAGALSGLRNEAESVEKSQAYLEEWERNELQESHDIKLRHSALPGLSSSESSTRRRKSSNNSTRSIGSSHGSTTSFILSGRYSEQVRQEMKAALSLLESSHDRARVLLSCA